MESGGICRRRCGPAATASACTSRSGANGSRISCDGWASGHFVELDPPRRLVFTWGWEMPGNPVPAGSSTVTVDLLAAPAGTLVRLTHTGLPIELGNDANAAALGEWLYGAGRGSQLALRGKVPG